MDLAPEIAPARVSAPSGELAALVAHPATGRDAPRAGVLAVPGYTGSKEDFIHLLPLLARAGHPAIAIDLRGQYESGGPEDIAAYTLDALGKDVAALLSDGEPPSRRRAFLRWPDLPRGGAVRRSGAVADPAVLGTGRARRDPRRADRDDAAAARRRRRTRRVRSVRGDGRGRPQEGRTCRRTSRTSCAVASSPHPPPRCSGWVRR